MGTVESDIGATPLHSETDFQATVIFTDLASQDLKDCMVLSFARNSRRHLQEQLNLNPQPDPIHHRVHSLQGHPSPDGARLPVPATLLQEVD